jgi:superfamily II DNA or RNA helicase
MNARSLPAQPVDLLDRYHRLEPGGKLVMRLKSLIFLPVGKTAFLACLTRSGLRMPTGKAWSFAAAGVVLEALSAQRLLTPDLACPAALLHAVAIDAVASAEGVALIEAVRRAFAEPRMPAYVSSTFADPEALIRLLRLAIYANDVQGFVDKRDAFERTIAPRRAAGVLATLFAAEPLAPDWLSSRDPVIQRALFEAKIGSLLWTGIAAPDLPALLARYLPQQHTAAFAALRPMLLHYALFAGRLDDVRRGLAAIEDISGETARAMQGAEAFLAGDNAAALVHYREALRLHRKRLGKRKIFLDDEHGLLFLLALLAAHDAALHPEIQAALDLALAQPTLYAGGMLAIQALLWLVQGLQTKATELLGKLRARMPGEPLSAACVCLAEHALGGARSQAKREDMLHRFEALEHQLPLIARIHAEILAAGAATPGRFAAFLAATEGCCAIACTRIVQLRQPWERALESLDAFLGARTSEPSRAAAKTKRLAWFLDPATQQIEVAEQSARGAGWSDGRPVAMKRLHEQDPRLDYLTPQDRAALRAIRKESGGWYGEELYAFDPQRAIPALIGHPAMFDARKRAQPLDLIAYPLELVVSEQRDGYRVALSHSAEAACVFLEAETPHRYRVVTFPQHLLALQEILGKRGLTVPKTARNQVIAMVRRDNPTLPIRAEIAEIEAPGIAARSMPVVQLRRQDEGLRVALMVRPFGAEGPSYVAGLGGRSVLASIAGQPMRANRDLAREVAERAALIEACPTLREHGGADAHEVVVETLERGLDLLLELQAYAGPLAVEWPHGGIMRVSEVDPRKLRMRVGQDHGWFSIDGAITLDDEQVVEMRYLLDRLDRTNGTAKGRFVPLEDGRFLALTQQLQAQLQRLAAVSEPHRGGRRLHALAAPTLDAVLEEAGEVKADAAWKRHVARIRGAEGFTPAIPANLQAELRDYQIEGFVWMSRLARWGAGACLADDMGLGKTVQAIAVMLERAGEGPSLVVAPTSVCANWEAEIARFAPTLATHRLAAPADRAGLIAGLGARDVLITSYGLLHQESEALAGRAWQVVVLDEAQAIKNAQTKRAQASLALQAGLRIALTGTPVENYLDELWSLFNFVNPGLLGSRDGFQRRFAVPIERDRDPQARAALRALLRPFLLRRTKAAVLSELPPRTEQTIQVEMGDAERAFYEALRQRALETIAALDSAPGKRKLHILAEITRLRRACCNPALIDAAAALPAAKQEAFLELVEELIRNRHRALVFSQFVGHLTLIRAALDARGIGYEYLDGSTPPAQRARRVAAFQSGDAPLFLISLRAGGTGLNLTAADYVVHLDPWWNPAVEDQASDRAHRIGQQRPVTVYRLIMQDSIEQRILRLHADKRDLASELLEGAEVSARLSEEQLLDLIRR